MTYFTSLVFAPLSLDLYGCEVTFNAQTNAFLYENSRKQTSFNARRTFASNDNLPGGLGIDSYTATQGAIVSSQEEALLNLAVIQLNNGLGAIGSYDHLKSILQSGFIGGAVTDFDSHFNQQFSDFSADDAVSAPISMTYGAPINFKNKQETQFKYSIVSEYSKNSAFVHASTFKLVEETVSPYRPINTILFSPVTAKNLIYGTQSSIFDWDSFYAFSFVLTSDLAGNSTYLNIYVKRTTISDRYYCTVTSFSNQVLVNTRIVPNTINTQGYNSSAIDRTTSNLQNILVTLNGTGLKTSAVNISRDLGSLYYRADGGGSFKYTFENILNFGSIAINFDFYDTQNSVEIYSSLKNTNEHLNSFRGNLPIRGRAFDIMCCQPNYSTSNASLNQTSGRIHALVISNGSDINYYYFKYLPSSSLSGQHRLEVAVVSPRKTNTLSHLYVLTNTTDGSASLRITEVVQSNAVFTETDLFQANGTNITLGTNVTISTNLFFGTRPSNSLVVWSDGYEVENSIGHTIVEFMFYVTDLTQTLAPSYYIFRADLTNNTAIVLQPNYPNSSTNFTINAHPVNNTKLVSYASNSALITDTSAGTSQPATTNINYLENGLSTSALPSTVKFDCIFGNANYYAFDYLFGYDFAFLINSDRSSF
jgi:hypothetical protein